MEEHLDVSGVTSLMEILLQSPGTLYVHIPVGQICSVPTDVLHDPPHQTLEKETLQCTPQLVKTVVKEIMEVESSNKIHSLACFSMTLDSKSHLVAPAVSTEYPVIQEDACSSLTQSRRTASLGPGQRGRARNSQNHGVSLARGTWPFCSSRNDRFSLKKTRTSTHHGYSQKVQLQRL